MSEEMEKENIQEEATEMVAVENMKGEQEPKFKLKLTPKVKTALKIGGIGLAGIGLFFLGKAIGSRSNNDEYEDVDYEVVDDTDEN